MKRTLIFCLVTVVTLTSTVMLRSQNPGAPQTPLQMIQTLKTQNQKVLNQQTATLQKLEELEKEAQQLRILARRT